MNNEAPAANSGNPGNLSHCPGCGGAWRDEQKEQNHSEDMADIFGLSDPTCGRCGLSRREAFGLLRGHAADVYVIARAAALRGRFQEARAHLRPLLSPGVFSCDESLLKLDALCATVLGERSGGDSISNLVLARADYAAAHHAAASGDYDAALLLTSRCLESAPCLLYAQKLHLLVLAGTGKFEQAAARRAGLAALLPEDPEITQWVFSEAVKPDLRDSPLTASLEKPKEAKKPGSPRRVFRRKSAASGPQMAVSARRSKSRTRWGVSLSLSAGAMILSALAIIASLSRLFASPETSAAALAGASPRVATAVGTTSPQPASQKGILVLEPELGQELKERRRQADFAQARQWFNRAVQARDAGNWVECDRYAAAAYDLGKNTYLGDESLVLRALAADNRGMSLATRVLRYAAIAESVPDSAYAPWALSRAAMISNRMGQPNKANRYRAEWTELTERSKQSRPANGPRAEAGRAAKKHGHEQH